MTISGRTINTIHDSSGWALTPRIAHRARNAARHRARHHQRARARILRRAQPALALLIRPKPTHGVGHLPEPGARDAVEEAAHARGAHRLPERVDHALVARRLHPHLCQVERAACGHGESAASPDERGKGGKGDCLWVHRVSFDAQETQKETRTLNERLRTA